MTSQKKSWQKVSWLPLVALIVLLGIGYILAMQQGWIEPGKSVFTTKSNQESTTTVTDEGVTW
jgi:hypothetical protein